MKATKFLPFVISLLLLSCQPEKDGALTQIDEDFNESVKYSSFFKTAECVKLESKQESLIPHIGKIKVDGERIFCFDPWSQLLFIFNKEGSFIAKVGKKGQGPGEFISCVDFVIDKKNKHVEILDAMGRKILVYDYDGVYLFSLKSLNALGFEKLSDDAYLAYSYNFMIGDDQGHIATDLALFNTKGKIIKSYDGIRKIPSDFSGPTFTNLFRSSDGCVYLIPTYEYTLFRIDQERNISKVTEFIFNRNPSLTLFESNQHKIVKQELIEKRYPHRLSNLIIDPYFIYFKYVLGKTTNQVLWNRRTNETFSINQDKWINDITSLPGNGFYGTFDKGLIQVIEPTEFLETFQQGRKEKNRRSVKNQEMMNRIEQIAISLKSEDNPVLVFYSYK